MAPVVRADQDGQAHIPRALQVVFAGQMDQQQPVHMPVLAHRFRDELVIAIVTAAHAANPSPDRKPSGSSPLVEAIGMVAIYPGFRVPFG